ncbi:MAG: hypothetical protein Q9191_002476 [Dirinaria sp. TL-2023a]
MLLSKYSLVAALCTLSAFRGAAAAPKTVVEASLDFFDDENNEVCAGNQQGRTIYIKGKDCIPLTPPSANMAITWTDKSFNQLTYYDDASCGHEIGQSVQGTDPNPLKNRESCASLSKMGKVASVKNTSS